MKRIGESLLQREKLGRDADNFYMYRTEIKSEFQAQIACHAEYLSQFPNARVTLEGHADERGTREYNIALGARRALVFSPVHRSRSPWLPAAQVLRPTPRRLRMRRIAPTSPAKPSAASTSRSPRSTC